LTLTPKKRGLFIAGTDTGVGKTVVTAGLVRYARNQGLRCLAVKPVETGCKPREGVLYPEDGAFLREASENDLSLDDCAPFRFSLPASPARAAAMEGSKLFLSDLEEHVRTVSESADLTVVEPAGGLMVPIEENLMVIDLALRLGFPTVLVARSGLGTINHTLLSVEAFNRREIELAGIVLSAVADEPGPEEEYTPGDLSRLVGDVPVLVLPRLTAEAAGDPQRIAQVMAEAWPVGHLRKWLGLDGA
jgi:dethiobiotin synthetase